MSTPDRPPPAKLAEPLGEDEIHVWSCAYRHGDGRRMLLRLLGAYLDQVPDAVVLAEQEHGRPVLADTASPPLRFNWSHSGDRALIAVARGVQPGIDLERRKRRRDVLGLAQRFFAPAEAEALERFDGDERMLAFLRLWTCKEALLKAHGRGLAFGMERVQLALRDGCAELVGFKGETASEWRLHELFRDDDWLAALAWRGPPMRVRWRGEFD